jgi:endonuclease YncB( thermonuclease family)
MRYITKMIALIFAVLTLTGAAFADFTGKVVGVIDGDTLDVLRDGSNSVRVRLSGIDCPEKKQAFGQRAKQFTSKLSFGKMVTVKENGSGGWGRTLGEVMLPDGRSLNHELVRAGWAWWYKQYAPKDAALAALEEQARAAKVGLWADAVPDAPWDYRKNQKQGHHKTRLPT